MDPRDASASKKDWLLTGQEKACTRIIWLFIHLVVCHHAENDLIHRTVDVDCPLVIASIGDTSSRQDQTRNEE